MSSEAVVGDAGIRFGGGVCELLVPPDAPNSQILAAGAPGAREPKAAPCPVSYGSWSLSSEQRPGQTPHLGGCMGLGGCRTNVYTKLVLRSL